jgi:hypothetical protein
MRLRTFQRHFRTIPFYRTFQSAATTIKSEPSASARPLKPLIIDGHNFTNAFFSSSHHWHLLSALRKITLFCSLSRKSGFEPVLFLDAAYKRAEKVDKARRRLAKDIREGNRRAPFGVSGMMGDLFRSQGVEINYSIEKECDEAVAFWAARTGGAVLSGDRGYFRYEHEGERAIRGDIFRDFQIDGEELVLVPSKPKVRRKGAVLEVSREKPETSSEYKAATINEIVHRGSYIRGSPTPLLRRLGMNPHVVARPLRQALYARILGSRSAIVTESFPMWDEKQEDVSFAPQEVHPDPTHDRFLESPIDAVEFLFQPSKIWDGRPEDINQLTWENHIYSLYAVTFEICSLGTGRSVWDMFSRELDLRRFYPAGFRGLDDGIGG